MDNKGQVGVIVAILVVSLMVAILVIIQTYYVPQWMKEREAEHMDLVANQFAGMKYSIDLQAMEKSPSPLINSITLGSKELPYFVSSRAFGSLQILSPSESNFSMVVSGTGRQLARFYEKTGSGVISYVESITLFGIKIDAVEPGDAYSANSPYFNISLGCVEQSGILLNLTIKDSTGSTIYNDVVARVEEGGIIWINLLDPLYNLSTTIMPAIHGYYNISLNSSSNGSFVIAGYKYGSIGTINFPPLLLARMGEIKYSSQNAYFVDQNYIYEGGAVILEQRTGSSVIHPPLISMINSSIPHINITAVDIEGVAGKTAAAGYGTYSIRTNYSSSHHYAAIGSLDLTIYTKYTNAWKNYMITRLNETGIPYTLEEGNSYVKFHFPDIRLEMDVVVIFAQIGPGWVV